jgi:hypothetical protein
MTVLIGTIQLRRGTAAQWTTANTLLLDGEEGFEKDTKKRKVGDGVTLWNDLPYLDVVDPDTVIDPDYVHTDENFTTAEKNALASHLVDTANPHETSLEQARLADNFFSGEVDMNSNRLRNLPNAIANDEPMTLGQALALYDVTLKSPEAFTPVGAYPTTYNGAAIKKNDTYRVASGTMGGKTATTVSLLVALVDAPAQVDANWMLLEGDFDQANESTLGVVRIVATVEIQDELTSENTKAVTAQKFWFGILRVMQLAWTWDLKQTFTTAPRFNSASASQYLKTDGTKDLTSVSAIPASDITESSTKKFVPQAVADNDFLVGQASGNTWIKKTLAEAKTILGISNVANVDTTSRSINFTFDGQGGVIATNSVATADSDWAGLTITGWEIKEVSDVPVSGSIEIDVWQDSYANYPPTIADTIFSGTKPNLSSQTKNKVTGLAIALTGAPTFKAKATGITSVLKVKLKLFVTQTA